MQNMKKKDLIILTAPVWAVSAMFLAGVIYKKFVKKYVYPCVFNMFTGYYCCGCGGTRSFYALLKGNILDSLRYNPVIPFAVLTLFLLWLEYVLNIYGKKIKLLPRNYIFWGGVIGAFFIFYIVRNFIPFLAP